MLEKISPVAVVKDSITLVLQRKKAAFGFVGVLILFFAIEFGMVFLLGIADAQPSVPAAVGTMILFFFTAVLSCALFGMVFMHYYTTAQRGRPKLFPPQPVKRFFCFLLMLVCLYFAAIFLTLLMMSPLFGVLAVFPMAEEAVLPFVLLGVVGLPLLVTSYAIIFRWMLLVPGVATGEMQSVSLAWKASKGHGLRMVGAWVLLSIPLFIVVGTLILIQMTIGSDVVGVVITILIFLFDLFFMLVATASFTVWYEKLRLRYIAIAGAETIAESATESA